MFGTLIATAFSKISRRDNARLLMEIENMDTTRLIEAYEAEHGNDDYTTDLERLVIGLMADDTPDRLYSPKWAEEQMAFLASF